MNSFSNKATVSIVGAGIAGLAAARTLVDAGHPVQIFEKSRGLGGRMANRRADDGVSFDHGAQYFTVRDARFRAAVESWAEAGLVARWPDPELGSDQKIVVIRDGSVQSEANSVERFVGVPAMNSICKRLAAGLEIEQNCRIAAVQPAEHGIKMLDEHGQNLGIFDCALITAPAEQSAQICQSSPSLSSAISEIALNPCWAVMATFSTAITDQWVGAFLHDSFLSWAARNSTKPGRSAAVETLVIHAKPDWTASRWEEAPESVAAAMLAEFARVTGILLPATNLVQAHRWKYAIPPEPSEQGVFVDESARIYACGDWACGARVEGAFLSGLMAAERLIANNRVAG